MFTDGSIEQETAERLAFKEFYQKAFRPDFKEYLETVSVLFKKYII